MPDLCHSALSHGVFCFAYPRSDSPRCHFVSQICIFRLKWQGSREQETTLQILRLCSLHNSQDVYVRSLHTICECAYWEGCVWTDWLINRDCKWIIKRNEVGFFYFAFDYQVINQTVSIIRSVSSQQCIVSSHSLCGRPCCLSRLPASLPSGWHDKHGPH